MHFFVHMDISKRIRSLGSWRGVFVACSVMLFTDFTYGEPSSPAPAPKGPAAIPLPEIPAPSPEERPATPELLPDIEEPEGGEAAVPVLQAGQDVTIYLNDGRRVDGKFVTRDDEAITLKIAAINVRFAQEDIDRLVALPPAEERYRQMRALVKDTDVNRLLSLADWARRQELYDEALRDLDLVLIAEPGNAEAQRLKKLIRETAGLKRRSGTADTSPDEPRSAPPAPRLKPAEFPVLTPEQINLMKVYEIDLADPPRVVIPRPAVEQLLVKYADNPLIPTTREGREEFLASDPRTILDIIFRVRAREYYGEVQVLDQPRSMAVFREKVHAGWLINNCATSRCHGGPDGGRLMLLNRRPNAETSVYTNLLILERFRTRDGKPLIDYDRPASSALLQMGLPRDDSAIPHPTARGWSPAFPSRDAPRFIDTVGWIQLMYRPRPDYPIEYTPPGERRAAPEPSAAPENRGTPR